MLEITVRIDNTPRPSVARPTSIIPSLASSQPSVLLPGPFGPRLPVNVPSCWAATGLEARRVWLAACAVTVRHCFALATHRVFPAGEVKGFATTGTWYDQLLTRHAALHVSENHLSIPPLALIRCRLTARRPHLSGVSG